MKITILPAIALFFTSLSLSAQSTKEFRPDSSFEKLINTFTSLRPFRRDSAQLPVLMKAEKFSIQLADAVLPLQLRRRLERNPFSHEKFPLCYSVLYHKQLVALFAPGKFACYDPDTWQRNKSLERHLNTKNFERHWLIDGQLTALSNGKYWQFEEHKGWQPYNKSVPMNDRPKLFEDHDFIVYNLSRGEFGGFLYFFDKHSGKTYYTDFADAVWVRKEPEGYVVLANSGHMVGTGLQQLIADPRTLAEWTLERASNNQKAIFKKLPVTFKFTGLQLFGGIEYNRTIYYLLHIQGITCLAALSDQTFTIVHPLFNNALYTHNPATTRYGDAYLINLDFYGIGGNREIACLLIRGNKITFLNWDDFHNYY